MTTRTMKTIGEGLPAHLNHPNQSHYTSPASLDLDPETSSPALGRLYQMTAHRGREHRAMPTCPADPKYGFPAES